MLSHPRNGVRSVTVSRRWSGQTWRIAAAAVCIPGISWGLSNRDWPNPFRSSRLESLSTVTVNRGDVVQVVTEGGSLESANTPSVRCRVESVVGLIETRSGAPSLSPVKIPAALGGPKDPAAPNARGIADAAKAASLGAAMASVLGSNPATGDPPTRGPAGAAEGQNSTTLPRRPRIRSFDYLVQPHIPLRANKPGQVSMTPYAVPPPKILSILDQGSHVRAGDVVCELDSSAFRDELQVQRLRFIQAKARAEQARSLLEASEIAFREYEQGIFPQDIELVRHYISTCATGRDRAMRNFEWSRAVAARGLRTRGQVKVDSLLLQDAEISLHDARAMLQRLLKYTSKRILTSGKAKLEAIRADLLALESSAQREKTRLKKIEAMIANCTVRAPRDGIVIHANRTNPWGLVNSPIREGLAVKPSQPIFRLLEPGRLQVRARINESQVDRIKSGQTAWIRFDADLENLLRGKVTDITAIPVPVNGPISDVRAYFATVRIESGNSESLRAGLSAEVAFQVETRHRVTRIPLEAIRWIDGRTFAALAITATTGPLWQWKPIALGVSDTSFAEVVSGLEPGDQVVFDSESLPAPEPVSPEPMPALAFEGRNSDR